jgi:hypothetical protein
VEQHPGVGLILGVDQSLARDPETAALLAASPWFQRRGFVFRDYPTVAKTLGCLGRAAAVNLTGPGELA